VIQGFREKLVSLNAELTLAQQEFTDADPTVQRLKAEIAETRRQIELEVARVRRSLNTGLAPELTKHEVDRIALEARAEAVTRAIARVEREKLRLPAESLQLARLTRDQQVQEALYSMLMSDREKLRLLEAREGPPFVVLDAAVLPEGRVWPRPTLIALLAAILSFVAATTLAFFVEYAERERYARGKHAYIAAPDEIQRPATHAGHRP
jgi:tyrosine-protein kinase Etk/Wzc